MVAYVSCYYHGFKRNLIIKCDRVLDQFLLMIKSNGSQSYGCWNVAKIKKFIWYENTFSFNQNKFVFNEIYFHYITFFHDIKIYFHSIKIYFYYMNFSLNTFLVSISGLPFVFTKGRILILVCKLNNSTWMWKSCEEGY